MAQPTIEPTAEQFSEFRAADADRPVTMLNLLRFRETADYSDHAALAPEQPISGREAYRRYSEVASETLEVVGGRVVFAAPAEPTVIGPVDETWDQVLLVEYPSRAAFLEMQRLPRYRAAVGHRSAALADSRLIPTTRAAAAR